MKQSVSSQLSSCCHWPKSLRVVGMPLLGGSSHVVSTYIVAPIYKPFRPFGRGGLGDLLNGMILQVVIRQVVFQIPGRWHCIFWCNCDQCAQNRAFDDVPFSRFASNFILVSQPRLPKIRRFSTKKHNTLFWTRHWNRIPLLHWIGFSFKASSPVKTQQNLSNMFGLPWVEAKTKGHSLGCCNLVK